MGAEAVGARTLTGEELGAVLVARLGKVLEEELGRVLGKELNGRLGGELVEIGSLSISETNGSWFGPSSMIETGKDNESSWAVLHFSGSDTQ